MVNSKPWDWSKNTDSKWTVPSEITPYLSERWQSLGFTDFFDLGCGLGRHSLYFAEKNFTITAMDLSQLAVDTLRESAEKRGLSIKTVAGDMLKLPFEDGAFDCIMAYNVIYHTDTAGFLKTLREIDRVLAPKGEIYITLISKNTWSFQHADSYRLLDENTLLRDEDETERNVPHFYVNIQDILQYFKEYEFVLKPVEITEYDLEKPECYSRHFALLAKKK